MGSKARKKNPIRIKLEEKEKTSAQCPMTEGIPPDPSIIPINITMDTAMLRSCRGKSKETMVKPTGNKLAVAACCRQIKIAALVADP